MTIDNVWSGFSELGREDCQGSMCTIGQHLQFLMVDSQMTESAGGGDTADWWCLWCLVLPASTDTAFMTFTSYKTDRTSQTSPLPCTQAPINTPLWNPRPSSGFMKWAHFKTRDFPSSLLLAGDQAVPGSARCGSVQAPAPCTLLLVAGWAARTSALSTLVLQKVPSEVNPKVRNHGEGPY